MVATIAEISIGLLLIYLILGALVMTLGEWWAQLTNARGRMLRRGIQTLLGDADSGALTDVVYAHNLAASLQHSRRLPAYVPGHLYTLVLFDLVVNGRKEGVEDRQPVRNLAQLTHATREDASDLLPNSLRHQLSMLLELAQNYEEALLIVEHWFNDSMARLTGWYKRHTQLRLFIIAFLVAVVFNADTLLLTNRLQGAQADGLVLGWTCLTNCDPADLSALQPIENTTFWLLKLAGWFLTAIALTVAAPLLFDLLTRVMHLRSTGEQLP